MFKISRVYFHSGRKNLGIQFRGAYSNISRKFEYLQRSRSINLHRMSLVQKCLRRCHIDLVSPRFGFPFSFYISVLGIPGYPPGITSDFMIVFISVWVYICYLLTGITTALMPAFKSSPINITESLFTAKLVNL